MSIFTMCDAKTPGAVKSEYWSKNTGRDLFLVESYKGCVVNTWERNGYNDSDFIATVWDEASSTLKSVEYASTRGWSYPNHAEVDATPEVKAKVAALEAEQARLDEEKRALREARTPTNGKRVVVVKAVTRGKNQVAVGAEGEVFYFGEDKFFNGNRYLNGHQLHLIHALGLRDPRTGNRVGIKLDDGRKIFVRALNVEVKGVKYG